MGSTAFRSMKWSRSSFRNRISFEPIRLNRMRRVRVRSYKQRFLIPRYSEAIGTSNNSDGIGVSNFVSMIFDAFLITERNKNHASKFSNSGSCMPRGTLIQLAFYFCLDSHSMPILFAASRVLLHCHGIVSNELSQRMLTKSAMSYFAICLPVTSKHERAKT